MNKPYYACHFILSALLIFLLCMTDQANKNITSSEPEMVYMINVVYEPLDICSYDLFMNIPDESEEQPVETYSIETEEEIEKAPSNRWGISLSEDEKDLLAKIVWLEARGEGFIGQVAVIEVIFNRMVDENYFHGTLYEVLSENKPCPQFTTWKNRNKAEPTHDIYEAIEEVLNGNTNILGFDYLYFSRGGHRRHKNCIVIGGHQFCTK